MRNLVVGEGFRVFVCWLLDEERLISSDGQRVMLSWYRVHLLWIHREDPR